jgi:hypothetical protein
MRVTRVLRLRLMRFILQRKRSSITVGRVLTPSRKQGRKEFRNRKRS